MKLLTPLTKKALSLAALVAILSSPSPLLSSQQGPFYDMESHRGLAKALFLGKDYDKAIEEYSSILQQNPNDIEALLDLGNIYYIRHDYEKSRDLFSRALNLNTSSKKALRGQALTLIALGDNDKAISIFEGLHTQDPFDKNIVADLCLAFYNAEEADKAIEILDKRIATNTDKKYHLQWKARILSWTKNYDASLNIYDPLLAEDPNSAPLLTEIARVYTWSRNINAAVSYYERIYTPTLDNILSERIYEEEAPPPKGILSIITSQHDKEAPPYIRYEALKGFAEKHPEMSQRYRDIIEDLSSEHHTQKTAYLEAQAKILSEEGKNISALENYEALIAISPSNQEALFSAGQHSCQLGLYDKSSHYYEEILALSPLHKRAVLAHELTEQKTSKPYIQHHISLWHEKGRGDLSKVHRLRNEISITMPWLSSHSFFVKGIQWLEEPYDDTNHKAQGITLGYQGAITPSLAAYASIGKKSYISDRYRDLWLFDYAVSYAFTDATTAKVGTKKNDEVHNNFSLVQGTQKRTIWGEINHILTKKIRLQGRGEYDYYSDDNRGHNFSAKASYQLTPFPNIFTCSCIGEFRTTSRDNIFTYTGPTLTSITYPYWTPHNYYAGYIEVENYHDLSEIQICENIEHTYTVKLRGGYDTEHNHSIALDASWNYKINKHFDIVAYALIHRSKEWDAESASLTLNVRF
jgi:tetratricopeptide (TPR) repeat protein